MKKNLLVLFDDHTPSAESVRRGLSFSRDHRFYEASQESLSSTKKLSESLETKLKTLSVVRENTDNFLKLFDTPSHRDISERGALAKTFCELLSQYFLCFYDIVSDGIVEFNSGLSRDVFVPVVLFLPVNESEPSLLFVSKLCSCVSLSRTLLAEPLKACDEFSADVLVKITKFSRIFAGFVSNSNLKPTAMAFSARKVSDEDMKTLEESLESVESRRLDIENSELIVTLKKADYDFLDAIDEMVDLHSFSFKLTTN